ncbi:class I SAM-dependent methyltransferase [Citricoccus sp.]|uniref:class I SAM-dependent methyltransferase n=1 Tax=Citricoccus sp. TaxID=1978372 RepID=UPI0028BD3930|nr:class I SAM-dependent methyltransferase [Citricoccus sp.]
MDENASQNLWATMVAHDPEHSRRYAERWRRLASEGMDLDGEARLIDAMASRGSRILDAGCGTGRVGGYLARCGHRVTGVDLDEHLIEVANEDHPEADWYVADLEALDTDALAALGESEPFDLVFSAGNVFGFLSPASRGDVLQHLQSLLRDGGRAVIGFGAGRGYDFADFVDDAGQAGFHSQGRYSSWQLDPFTDDADFLVAVLSR